MTVQNGGYLYEQFFLCAPLQLLTQILWHMVQTPLAALTSQDSITSQFQALHRNLKYNHSGPLHLLHTQANYRGNAAANTSRPSTKQQACLFNGAQIH